MIARDVGDTLLRGGRCASTRCGLCREQQRARPLSDRVEEHLRVLLSLPLRREHLLQDAYLD